MQPKCEFKRRTRRCTIAHERFCNVRLRVLNTVVRWMEGHLPQSPATPAEYDQRRMQETGPAHIPKCESRASHGFATSGLHARRVACWRKTFAATIPRFASVRDFDHNRGRAKSSRPRIRPALILERRNPGCRAAENCAASRVVEPPSAATVVLAPWLRFACCEPATSKRNASNRRTWSSCACYDLANDSWRFSNSSRIRCPAMRANLGGTAFPIMSQTASMLSVSNR